MEFHDICLVLEQPREPNTCHCQEGGKYAELQAYPVFFIEIYDLLGIFIYIYVGMGTSGNEIIKKRSLRLHSTIPSVSFYQNRISQS